MKKYCFYYKGEKENPYERFSDIGQWWWHESVYFREGLPEDHKRWEKLAIEAANDIPAIEFLMCAGDVPIETKGFLCYTVGTTLGHAPLEKFHYLREYGRGFLPEHLYTGEHIDTPMSEEARISLCRYYKGEDQNPFNVNDQRYTFWDIEYGWFKLVANDYTRSSNYIVPFLLAFDGGLPGFKIDETIKATLFNHYMHFNGSKDGFGDFLLRYMTLVIED